MKTEQRFTEALDAIDAANREDPRVEMVNGEPQPRELLFARRVHEWVARLVQHPSEELLLAARAHTLRRWKIPRDQYPKTTVGYHKWRNTLAQFHAEEADTILRGVGYPVDAIQTVRAFITKENWPESAEACALEDADCLVFLETKLSDYLDDWDERKMLRILERTVRKMTPEAQALALQLKLSEREMDLVRRAASGDSA